MMRPATTKPVGATPTIMATRIGASSSTMPPAGSTKSIGAAPPTSPSSSSSASSLPSAASLMLPERLCSVTPQLQQVKALEHCVASWKARAVAQTGSAPVAPALGGAPRTMTLRAKVTEVDVETEAAFRSNADEVTRWLTDAIEWLQQYLLSGGGGSSTVNPSLKRTATTSSSSTTTPSSTLSAPRRIQVTPSASSLNTEGKLVGLRVVVSGAALCAQLITTMSHVVPSSLLARVAGGLVEICCRVDNAFRESITEPGSTTAATAAGGNRTNRVDGVDISSVALSFRVAARGLISRVGVEMSNFANINLKLMNYVTDVFIDLHRSLIRLVDASILQADHDQSHSAAASMPTSSAAASTPAPFTAPVVPPLSLSKAVTATPIAVPPPPMEWHGHVHPEAVTICILLLDKMLRAPVDTSILTPSKVLTRDNVSTEPEVTEEMYWKAYRHQSVGEHHIEKLLNLEGSSFILSSGVATTSLVAVHAALTATHMTVLKDYVHRYKNGLGFSKGTGHVPAPLSYHITSGAATSSAASSSLTTPSKLAESSANDTSSSTATAQSGEGTYTQEEILNFLLAMAAEADEEAIELQKELERAMQKDSSDS